MVLKIINLTGSEIKVAIVNNIGQNHVNMTRLLPGKTMDLPLYQLNQERAIFSQKLHIENDLGDLTTISIPNNMVKYTLAIAAELESGNHKLISPNKQQIIKWLSDNTLPNIDEIASIKIGGLGISQYNPEYNERLSTTIENKIAKIACKHFSFFCSQNFINWFKILELIMIILVISLFGLIIYSNKKKIKLT